MVQSGHNFANDMRDEHVQFLFFVQELHVFLQDSDYELINRLWNAWC